MSFFKIATVVTKALFRKPTTLMYPTLPQKHFRATRGHVVNHIKSCNFCGLCQINCPTQALTVNKKEKSWTIDRYRCITCNSCVDVCPEKCLEMDTRYSPVSTVKETEFFLGARVSNNAKNPKNSRKKSK